MMFSTCFADLGAKTTPFAVLFNVFLVIFQASLLSGIARNTDFYTCCAYVLRWTFK